MYIDRASADARGARTDTPALPTYDLVLRTPKPFDRAHPTELRTIGNHVRKRRLDLGLLQREVALRIGVDPTSIFNWEAGRHHPSLRHLPAALDFLDYAPRHSPEATDLRRQIRPVAGDRDSAWTPWLKWSASGGRWSRTGIRARVHRLMRQSPRPSRILALAARFTVLPLQAFLAASAVLLTRHDGGSGSAVDPERRISSRVSTVMAAGASLSRSGCVETDVTPSCIGRASDLDPTSDIIGCICPGGAPEPAHFGRQSVRNFET